MLVRTDVDLSNQYFMDGSSFNTQVFYRIAGGLRAYAGANVGPITMPNATWSLISATFNTTSSKIALGSTTVSGSVGAFTSTGITLGNIVGGASGVGMNGNIALVIAADDTYSSEVEALVRSEIALLYPNLTL